MTLQEKQQSLIDDFNIIPDPQERLSAVISRAASKLPEVLKIDANLVPGCISRVWLHGELVNGRTQFLCAADSPIVQGLATLLCDLYSDATPAEAATVEPTIWEALAFTKLLSPTRLNGLAHVRKRICEMAQSWNEAMRA